jgi:AraC family transcriptional regulator
VTQSQSLTINWNNKNPLSQILPRSTLLSSSEANWNNLQIDRLYQPAHETPEHSHTRHILALVTKGAPIQIERKLDGKFYSSYLKWGNFFLIPAGVTHQVSISGDAEYLCLSLEPDFICRIADELVNRSSIRLIPQHSVNDPLIQNLGLALQSQLLLGNASRLYIESASNLIAAHLLQHYATERLAVREYNYGLAPSKLEKVVEYIERHLSSDLSLEEIAQQIDVSQSHFSRLFKQSVGLSPWQYVIQRRVETAKELLKNEDLTIDRVSDRLGFLSHSQFTIFFRKYTGVSPKQYRQQI